MNRSFRSKSFFMGGVFLFSTLAISAARAGSDAKIVEALRLFTLSRVCAGVKGWPPRALLQSGT